MTSRIAVAMHPGSNVMTAETAASFARFQAAVVSADEALAEYWKRVDAAQAAGEEWAALCRRDLAQLED